ncbi:hypothetical protein BJX61DRAFT_552096 [Aspergillus egyptiacus]|nr:hypothetical protein BJX61DRAFT_552096 [Aspergillus egyptiacus]
MAPSFHSLPPEVLLTVTEILASEHLPSLHAFSLASKACCAIANSNRFRNIHFQTCGENRLFVDIAHWEGTLQRHNAYSTVRRLSVHGFIPLPKFNDPSQIENPDIPLSIHRPCPGEDEWTERQFLYSSFLSPGPNPVDLETMAAWKPLARFIKKLLGLRDLLWAGWAAFPPCILEVLHQDLPKCRIHLRSSTLRHLYGSSTLPEGYESYEYALATSPSLSSLVFRMANLHNAAVYTHRAVLRMAAGLAPNLTQVYMQYINESSLIYDGAEPEPPRTHLFTKPPAYPSRVRSLTLHDPTPKSTETWNEHTPFSNLTMFQLHGDYNYDLLSKLSTYDFHSLKSLVLRFTNNKSPRCRSGVVAHLDTTPDSFLANLPPLESLLISAPWAEQPLSIPFAHHGPKLRKLGLLLSRSRSHPGQEPPHIVLEQINQIKAHCPRLRHLTIRIPRTQGDAHEVEIYRALDIASLSSLTIELDCTALNKENFKRTLVNLAVDEKLVRSIFSTVTNSSSPSSLLQTLRVEVFMSIYGELEIFHALMHDSIWEAFRAPDGIFVHDSLRYKRKPWRKIIAEAKNWMGDVPVEKEFRELWPSRGGHWMQDWHSFPLQLT